MENQIQNTPQYDDEIDLGELFSVLWAGKKRIIRITAFFAVFSVIVALSIPNQYTATTSLVPTEQETGGLSGMLGQMGGLASIAGLGIPGESSQSTTAQEIMKSWAFIDDFINESGIAVEVYAGEGWSGSTKGLEIDSDLYDTETKTWLVENVAGEVGPPSSWKLYESFKDKVAVSSDVKTGIVGVSMTSYSPYVAKKWLDLYIVAINKHMQAREVTKLTNNIDYLKAQVEKTSIAEAQEVLYRVIEEQIKAKMLAEANPEHTFLIVSPSMLPEEKSQPKRALICILVTLLGGMLSVLFVLVRHYTRASPVWARLSDLKKEARSSALWARLSKLKNQ